MADRAKEGIVDGLFKTKIKLIKNLYIPHRATLKGDIAQLTFKPFYK